MEAKKTTIAEQLKAGRCVSTFTSGRSMEPLLYEKRTHVIIEPIRRVLHTDELPIYLRPDGKYVIHRIIRADDNYYYTRGDNCISFEKVPKDWVIGVVSIIYRDNKEIHVTDKSYKLYVTIWRYTYQVRRLYNRGRVLLRKVVKIYDRRCTDKNSL